MISKRIFDIVSSAAALALLSPVLVIVAVLTKLDSPGPVFYRQERVGLNLKSFRIAKFRTMVDGADQLGSEITSMDDGRITRLGSFLRHYKIDELPQLWNVLKGEMSIVGPRPETPKFCEYYSEEEKAIVYSVRPGITDLASIAFRFESEKLGGTEGVEQAYVSDVLPQKLKLKLKYVRNRSFLGDLKIIFQTLKIVFWR